MLLWRVLKTSQGCCLILQLLNMFSLRTGLFDILQGFSSLCVPYYLDKVLYFIVIYC